MKKLTLSLFCLSFAALTTHAQIVTIPDPNFKAALITLGVDLNSDGQIQLSEAQAITFLYVSNKSITDLTGIAAFTNLDSLDCSNNQLTALNVSNNTALTYLLCGYNQLTTLDLSSNTALAGFDCTNNLLTSLNISTCTALTSLTCGYNQLTTLDVSNNTAVATIYCDDNQLTVLDVSNDTALVILFCSNNPNMPVICINNTQLGLTIAHSYNWIKDASASWSTNCTTSIYESNNLSIAPKLVNAYNLMGQEIIPEQVKKGIYIYHYSDGSVRKIGKFDDVK
jgi:Leucine-rich repeat (LRR) protein